MSITQQLRKNNAFPLALPKPLLLTTTPLAPPPTDSLSMNRMHLDMLDKLNSGSLVLSRTEEDEEFSQILKKQSAPVVAVVAQKAFTIPPPSITINRQYHQPTPVPTTSISAVPSKQIKYPNFSMNQPEQHSFLLEQQSLPKVTSSTLSHMRSPADSSSLSSKQFNSPQFGLQSAHSLKNDLHNSAIHKKEVKALKRNLFYDCESDPESHLTLKQYSDFSFQRNPYISKTPFDDSSSTKTVPIAYSQCAAYKFLCPPCFQIASSINSQPSSQENVTSYAQQSTAKKSKQNNNNDVSSIQNDSTTTAKKGNASLYESVVSTVGKLPCFCDRGVVGLEEFTSRLASVHSSLMLKPEDLKPHYEYILWKLSASSSSKLSIETVYFQLEYRIYLTYLRDFKSSLTSFLSNQKQLLSPSTYVLLIASISEDDTHFVIEYTDTWVSVFQFVKKSQMMISSSVKQCTALSESAKQLRMNSDELLEKLIRNQSIRPRMKVRVGFMTKVTTESLLSSSSSLVKQHVNSRIVSIPLNCFQREVSSRSCVGIRNNTLFLRTLKSIKPKGGVIPLIDVVIMKKYPLLAQYLVNDKKKKVVTYAKAVSEGIVSQPGECFFAKIVVFDSIFVYDRSVALSTQPKVEIIVEFTSHEQYKKICLGERIRISEVNCEFVDVAMHHAGGYKLTLRAQFSRVTLQHVFLKKIDLPKTTQFYTSIAKNIISTNKSIADLPTNAMEIKNIDLLEFDIYGQFISISNNNSLIIVEILLRNEMYRCEVRSHHPFLLEQCLALPIKQSIQFKNVTFKWINQERRTVRFATSFLSYIEFINALK